MSLIHCWEDGPRVEVDADLDIGSTCMLLSGHDGPHEFTPDNKIGVHFAPTTKVGED